MDINDHNNIFTPAVYHGRAEEEPYGKFVKDVDINELYAMVKTRADVDGQWCIDNGRVGENNSGEPKMRAMMEFVSTEKNILQAVDHEILKYGGQNTVDLVCRDLANAARWAASIKK